MTDNLEQLEAHRHAIATTIPLLEAIRSLAEIAYRRAECTAGPVAAYADRVRPLLTEAVAALREPERHALLSPPAPSPAALIVIAAERGLCGAFNDRVVDRALSYIRERRNRGEQVIVFCLGTRGRQLLERAGQAVAHAAPLPSFVLPPYASIEAIALQLLGLQDQLRSVPVAVVHNAPGQRWQYEVTIRQLFPPTIDPPVRGTPPVELKPAGDAPNLVVHLLTEYLLIELYRAVVESAISEQLARVATMRLAVDHARRLLDQLTLEYNLARQHVETNALLEIITGYQATAVEGSTLL